MIHGLAALGKLDDFVWTPKVLIRDQVIRSCIMNNDDSQTFKNTIGIKVQNMKMDFKTEEAHLRALFILDDFSLRRHPYST